MARRIAASVSRFSIIAFLALALGCTGAKGESEMNAAAPAQTASAPAEPADSGTPAARNGPYLGQKPPGAEPESFGQGFISGQFHSAPTFAPDGAEFWWAGSYRSERVYASRIQDGVWTSPEVFTLPGGMDFLRDPFVSPDGKRMYFISMAALPGSNTGGKENIWMAERAGDGWAEPVPLPASVNELTLHWTVSVAANYNLYFSATVGPYDNDIYLSRWADGRHQAPEQLPRPLNSPINEYTPNIAPDESYILFAKFESGSDTPRLHISYASQAGWTEPKLVENLPYCMSPIVTPDRAYVVFLSSASSLGWRDTAFVEALRASR